MIKKAGLFFVLAAVIILINGCQTIKGVATGAADGAKKDWQSIWQTTKKADDWFRENLW